MFRIQQQVLCMFYLDRETNTKSSILALKHSKCLEYKYFKGGKNDRFSVKG